MNVHEKFPLRGQIKKQHKQTDPTTLLCYLLDFLYKFSRTITHGGQRYSERNLSYFT